MALFKRNETQQAAKPRERTQGSRGAPAEGTISIIGPGMTILGDVTTDGVVRVEGEVQGTIRAGKAVILGQGGLVNGSVYTADAVVGGTITGSIVATNRLELQGTSLVEGEITTRSERLKLEEGARFAGKVIILESDDYGTSRASNSPPESSASSSGNLGSAAAVPALSPGTRDAV